MKEELLAAAQVLAEQKEKEKEECEWAGDKGLESPVRTEEGKEEEDSRVG
jgi:hypothetical protein